MTNNSKSKYTTLEIDIKLLPKFWWLLLREAVNDYLQFDEDHERHQQATSWLFLGEEKQIRPDVVCFYTVAEAFDIHKDKFRFSLQRLKDRSREEHERDPRGRKPGYMHDSKIEELIELSQIKTDTDYNFI